MKMKDKLKRIYRYIRYGVPVVQEKHITAKIVSLSQNDLLKGRTAIVTGGTSGIGLEIARAFINAGSAVVITSRSADRLQTVIESFPKQSPIYGFELDNRDVDQINHCIPMMQKKFDLSKIDILVNNAGVNRGPDKCSFEENFDAILQTNLKGTYFFSRMFAEYLKENGIRGNILNIASSSSDRPATEAYTLSKWGVKGLTKGLARVYSHYGIVVNGIAPGPTSTPMIKGCDSSDELTHEKGLTGRMTHPIEVANMAVILVSDMSRMVVGDIVYMSGGAGNVYNEDIEYYF